MGDQSSSKKFYDAHFGLVFQFMLRKTNNIEQAKDLTHDVFLKAFLNWDKLVTADAPKAFLFSISKNILIDYYRASLKRPAALVEMEDVIGEEINLTEGEKEGSDDRLIKLKQAIEELPKQRREIFRMKKLQGMTTEEIANKLSLSQRTVENQLYRAMRTIRGKFASIFL